MWSSTPSTSSTVSLNNNYIRPVAEEILNDCCKNREFYKPTKQFDNKFGYNIFGEPITESNKNNKTPKIYEFCEEKFTEKETLINIWANQNLYNDNRTLQQKDDDDKQNKKTTEKILRNYETNNFKNNIHIRFNGSSYIERSYCYPTVMCYLGWKTMLHTKDILRFIEYGIQLFIIDLRFGSPDYHTKMIKTFEKIRKTVIGSCPFAAKKIFGLAFIMHSPTIKVGLLYKDQSIILERDSTIILTADRRFSDRGTQNVIYINFSDYVDLLELNDEIRIGNEVIVIVQGKTNNSIICCVKKEGLLKSRQLVQFPLTCKLKPKARITKEEDEDITYAISMGCDYLISNCVTEALRAHINWTLAISNRLIIILQRITFVDTFYTTDIDRILSVTDGLYIYGKCSVNSFPIQKYAMEKCMSTHKVICRADNIIAKDIKKFDSDTLKYQLLYPDCIVFSPNCFDITKIRSTIQNVYPNMNRDNFILSLSPLCQQDDLIENQFCRHIIILAVCERASCIIVINNSGHFVKLLSKNRPMVPIISSFIDIQTGRNCLLSRNVYVTIYRDAKPVTWREEVNMRLTNCIAYGQKIRCIDKDKPFLLCYDSSRGLSHCDTCRLLWINKTV